MTCIYLRYILCMCYTKGLPLVHAQSAGSLAITITFWTILLSIAGLAVNFIVMDCDSCAVQALPTYHCKTHHNIIYLCIYFKHICVF